MTLEVALNTSNFDNGGADVDEVVAPFSQFPAVSIKCFTLFSVILFIVQSYFSSLPTLHRGLQFFRALKPLVRPFKLYIKKLFVVKFRIFDLRQNQNDFLFVHGGGVFGCTNIGSTLACASACYQNKAHQER